MLNLTVYLKQVFNIKNNYKYLIILLIGIIILVLMSGNYNLIEGIEKNTLPDVQNGQQSKITTNDNLKKDGLDTINLAIPSTRQQQEETKKNLSGSMSQSGNSKGSNTLHANIVDQNDRLNANHKPIPIQNEKFKMEAFQNN